ncbi:MAG: GDSL-type esterase/lipase family protein [Candidatus Nanoarchaeia archaeon]
MEKYFITRIRDLQRIHYESKKILPFQRLEPAAPLKLLFLGDSLTVGVGVCSERSLPGLFAKDYLNAHIETHAFSGAKTQHVLHQLEKASERHYDFALITVGANDILGFTRTNVLEKHLSFLLEQVKKKSDHVVLTIGGRMDYVPLIPKIFRKHFYEKEARIAKMFNIIAEQNGVLFLDLAHDELINQPFKNYPEQYFCRDGLHPNERGYQFAYTQIKHTLHQQGYLPSCKTI